MTVNEAIHYLASNPKFGTEKAVRAVRTVHNATNFLTELRKVVMNDGDWINLVWDYIDLVEQESKPKDSFLPLFDLVEPLEVSEHALALPESA